MSKQRWSDERIEAEVEKYKCRNSDGFEMVMASIAQSLLEEMHNDLRAENERLQDKCDHLSNLLKDKAQTKVAGFLLDPDAPKTTIERWTDENIIGFVEDVNEGMRVSDPLVADMMTRFVIRTLQYCRNDYEIELAEMRAENARLEGTCTELNGRYTTLLDVAKSIKEYDLAHMRQRDEAQAENERLRALLPNISEYIAIANCVGVVQRELGGDSDHLDESAKAAATWLMRLQNLESEGGMMSEWRPVEGGEIQNANSDVLEVYTTELGTQELMSHTDAGATTYPLPDNYRLCERIPDEPITAEALERAGWEGRAFYDGEPQYYAYTVGDIEIDYITNGQMQLSRDEHDGDYVNVIHFDNVHTMSDLRTLVRLLGGES